MYIIQMADLHIGSETKCVETEKSILTKGIQEIKRQIPKNQKVMVCVCGDIIDSKGLTKQSKAKAKGRYEEAAQLLRELRQELQKDYEVQFRFCMGNHDVTHVDEFIPFAAEFDAGISKKRLEDGYFEEIDGMDYVFLNSCAGGQHEHGEVDYAKLEHLMMQMQAETPKLFILHHTVMSMYEKDTSSIRNAGKLLSIIQENNVLGVLHGHIHGRERFSIGERKCRMVGIGALFSRNNANVNSQFNIWDIRSNVFREISTYVYMADGRTSGDAWYKICIEEGNDENYFRGSNFQEAYQKLMNKLSYQPVLNNAVMQINCTYEEFKNNLHSFLETDELVIGDKHYTYFKLAEMWEEIEVPDCLYFNHGEHFKIWNLEENSGKAVHGIQLIVRQLREKPTGNKAILTTSNETTISKMQKGQEYVPSLMYVQFSRSSSADTLYVHMDLRALEAGRFLKINICEILWLLERLKEQNIIFTKVDIAISAFRVQIREGFNCFLKADIDGMTERKMSLWVYQGEIARICRMLEEKKDASETITKVTGMEILYECMKMSNDSNGTHHYSQKIIDKLEQVLHTYRELNDLHQQGSIITQKEDACETEIRKGIEAIITELKKEDKAGVV